MHQLLRNPVLYCLVGMILALSDTIRTSFGGLFVLSTPILVFALFAHLHKGEEPTTSSSEIGDNCYLIGFIFTLWVITVSLFDRPEFAGTAESTNKRLQLLNTIGIALGTSVVGMLCRMLFHHIGMDKFTQMDDSLSTVATQAMKLNTAFDELVSSTRKANSDIHKYTSKIADEMEALLNQFRESLSNIPSVVDDSFKTTIDAIFEEIKKDLDEILTEHLKASLTINQDTLTEVKKMITEAEKVNKGLSNMNDNLGEVSDAFDKVHNSIIDVNSKIKDTQEEDAGLEDKLGKVSEALGKSLAGITQFNEKLTEIIDNTNAYESKATALKEASGEIEKVLKGHIDSIKELEESLKANYEKAVETATKESEKLYSSLLALAKEASEKK